MDSEGFPKDCSEEIKEEWKKTEIPSLYDCFLTNERIAFELRKQNKEIKNLSTVIQNLQEAQLKQLKSEEGDAEEFLSSLIEKEEILSEKFLAEQKQYTQILMNTMDSVFFLLQASKKATKELLELLPKKWGFFQKKTNQKEHAEAIGKSLFEGIKMIYEKLIISLADFHVEVIYPNKDDAFDPEKHRAVQKLHGSNRGKIAKLLRVGFKKRELILRSADVIVY